MKIGRVVSTIAVLCLFSFPFFAQEAVPNDEVPAAPVISRISFSGLKRTRESYMQTVLKKYYGLPVQELDMHDLEVTLQEQGLFSEVSAACEIDETGECTLHVTVTEKIAFLPIPFAMYSSSTGFMGGLVVMDTNAFGVKDTYVVGGVLASSMQVALMTFSKPSLSLTQPGFSVSGSFTHRKNKLHDGDDSLALAYRTLGGGAGISLTDKLTEHTNAAVGVRYQYTNITLDDDFSAYANDLKTYHAISATGEWGARFPELNEWFLSAKSLRVKGDVTHLSTGTWSPSVDAQILVQQPLPITRIRLIAQGAGHWSHDAPPSLWASPSTVGTTIMPDKFDSPRMLGAHAGLEVALVKTKIATFSIYGLYEHFFGEDFDGSGILNLGYSAGAKMYLAKISFPALSLGFSHNVSKNSMKFTAAFGISF